MGWLPNQGHEAVVTIINLYTLERASKYMRQTLTANNRITRVGDFHVPVSIMERTTRQDTSHDIEGWNDMISQCDLTAMDRTSLIMGAENTLFSCNMELSSG